MIFFVPSFNFRKNFDRRRIFSIRVRDVERDQVFSFRPRWVGWKTFLCRRWLLPIPANPRAAGLARAARAGKEIRLKRNQLTKLSFVLPFPYVTGQHSKSFMSNFMTWVKSRVIYSTCLALRFVYTMPGFKSRSQKDLMH